MSALQPIHTAAGTPDPNLGIPAAGEQAGTPVSLLEVDYRHIKTSEGGDLYLTRYGLPFWQNLLPENWYATEWFESKRE